MFFKNDKNPQKSGFCLFLNDTGRKIKYSLKNSGYLKQVYETFSEFKQNILRFSAALAAVFLICTLTSALDLKIGYEVIIDGETIGLVSEKADVYNAISEVSSSLREHSLDDNYSKSPVFVLRMISGKDTSSKNDIKEHLFSHIDYMVSCFGVYIDQKPYFATTTKEAAEFVLKKHTENSPSYSADAQLSFIENVEIKEGHLHLSYLKTPDEALSILSGRDNKKKAEYIIEQGDSLWTVANKTGISVERLLALNEGIKENVKIGDKIVIEKSVPLIQVKAVKEAEFIEEIPFSTEKISDSEIYEDTVFVSTYGKNGESKILCKVTEIDGEEVSRLVLKTDVIKEPITQIEKIGTKKRPPTTGTGTFITPSYGSLSSRFGSRWGRRHTGIDVSGSYNSPIKAADGGKVTYSDWMDGYGYYIIIDHENGYETAYGHCSELLVKAGSRVSKGDIIAKMGNTGRTTGTHLHFEVKKDGEYIDPLKFVSY